MIHIRIKIKCEYCNKEYSTTEYLYKRAKTHCCSRECSENLKRSKSIKVNCIVCGKEIIMSKSQYERHNHHCCSRECASIYKHRQTQEIRKCEICGEEFECSKTSYKRFCSNECQNKWQTTCVGENNAKYNRKEVECKNCGKHFYVRNYKINNKNLFCSQECSREWLNNNTYQSKEWKEKHRTKALKMLNKGQIGTETLPQKIVNELL